jgi:hypothetical protein
VVPEGAALRYAAARTGDAVPPLGGRLAGLAGAWVDIDDDDAARCLGQIEFAAEGRRQVYMRHLATNQMVGSAVIDGDRETFWSHLVVLAHLL